MLLGLEAVCLFLLCQQELSKSNAPNFVGSDSCRAELAGTGAEFGMALDRKQNAYVEVRQINGTPMLLVIQYAHEGDKCGTVRDIAISPDRADVFEFECVDHADKNRTVIGVRAEKSADTRNWKALHAWVVNFEKLSMSPTADPVTCLNFDYSGQDDGSDVRTRADSGAKDLPHGVLKALAAEAQEYCEEQFEQGFRKGCENKFAEHLRWCELAITPSGQTAVLVENDNLGFCGSGGCALYLLVQQKDAKFTQVLASHGGVGTIERVTVLKKTTRGHYDIQVMWNDRKSRSVYQWDGSQYLE